MQNQKLWGSSRKFTFEPASQGVLLCPAVREPVLQGHPKMVSDILWFPLGRLGLQHGHPLPLPQLESVCHRLRSALHRVHGGPEVHAGEPTVPARGESVLPPQVRAMGQRQGLALLPQPPSPQTQVSAWISKGFFMSLSLVFPDGQTWRSLDDSQASPWHQHESQGDPGEGVHGECVVTCANHRGPLPFPGFVCWKVIFYTSASQKIGHEMNKTPDILITVL